MQHTNTCNLSVVVMRCADEEGHGLLACRDISLSRRKDGSPWLLGCGGHGKVLAEIRSCAYIDANIPCCMLSCKVICITVCHTWRPSCNNVMSNSQVLLARCCLPWRQVYRAVRKGVQDAAVKLLINVDTAQLAVFSRVRSVFEHM